MLMAHNDDLKANSTNAAKIMLLEKEPNAMAKFLLDTNENPQQKAYSLSKSNHTQLNTLLKVMDKDATDTSMPLGKIIQLVTQNNSEWLQNALFLKEMENSIQKQKNLILDETDAIVDKAAGEEYFELINEIEEKVVAKYIEEMKVGKVSANDLENLFGDPWIKTSITGKIALETAKLLIDDKIPQNTRAKIFELGHSKIFKNMPQSYNSVHARYLAYLLQNFQAHIEYLKKNPSDFLYLGLSYFPVELQKRLKIDPNEILKEETKLAFQAGGLDFFYTEVSKAIKNTLLRDNRKYTAESELMLSFITSDLYSTFAQQIPYMIFMEEATIRESKAYEPTLNQEIKIIYNNDDYIISNPVNDDLQTFTKGQPLVVDDKNTTPIGYNIHYPASNKINQVFIQVYGGFLHGNRNAMAYRPGALQSLQAYLLNTGCMVITLNLPDLLKLDIDQRHMPEALHQEIHSAINKFYQVLKNSPESLTPILKNLSMEDKKVFLYGASFGGRTAIRHAELYPNTFDGYISHNGTIDGTMSKKSDYLRSRGKSKYEEWLDPGRKEEIAKLKAPLLLMQSLDDNNVNAKITLRFYKNLEAQQKSSLARVCITQAGNPIPSKGDKLNKGHFTPETEKDFLRYGQTVLNFMAHGPSALPEVTHWRAYIEDKLANKFYLGATVQKQFIAKALKIYKSQHHSLENIDLLWDEIYKPIFYRLNYVDNLIENQSQSESEIKNLKYKGLTDEVIMNVLTSQDNLFKQFVKEYNNISIAADVNMNKLFNNKEIIEHLRNIITSLDYKNTRVVKFWLEALYRANPHLLEPLYPDFAQDSKIQEAGNKAKTKFKNVVTEEKRMIAHVWQQAKKKLQEQKGAASLAKNLTEANKNKPKLP